MSITDWNRPPDKVARLGDMPVMLWTKPGELRAICGEVEIKVDRREPGRYAASIQGTLAGGGAFDYSGQEFDNEPDAREFEKHVIGVLETLDRTGELHGQVARSDR